MAIPSIFTDVVNVSRRADSDTASRDALGNPVYGTPSGWSWVYTLIKVRISFTGRAIAFNEKGELIRPSGTLYVPKGYTLKPMDRIITVNCPGYAKGIEYVVDEIHPVMLMHGIVDHYQGTILLPE